jgi:hypothetical protein
MALKWNGVWPRAIFLGLLLTCSGAAYAVEIGDLATDDTTVREATQALLSFLSFSVIPDSTADALQVNSRTGDDPAILLTQLGGGYTREEDPPIYLEGYVGYAQYDPDFVVTGNEQSGVIKTTWRTLSATGGIGYDFKLAEEWAIRPILNASLAHMTSDASIQGLMPGAVLSDRGASARDWLDDGWLTAGGIGGSLVLDFERRRNHYEADLELRYTHYRIVSLDTSEGSVEGQFDTDNVGLWGRLMIPTGRMAFNRRLRWVFEGAHTWFGNQRTEVLGVEHLTKIGAGIELDLGDTAVPVQRFRIVGRYVHGEDVAGVSVGFGASF